MMNIEIFIMSEIKEESLKEEPLKQVEENDTLQAPEKVSTNMQILYRNINLTHEVLQFRPLIVYFVIDIQ